MSLTSGADQEVRCVTCGLTAGALVREIGSFRIVRCGGCKLIFVEGSSDLPSLDRFYGPSYFTGEDNAIVGYRDYLAERPLHLWNAHSLLAESECLLRGPGRRLLDIGCAHGFLLEAARARGWDVTGVDISQEAVRYAQEELGLPVFHGGVEAGGFAPESFDLVCMNGTIEHLADPMATVREAARLLRAQGLLAITTIDVEGWLGYFSWKPPEHLYYFSAGSLSRLLEAAGFVVERRRIYWKYFSVADLLGRLWGFWRLPGPGKVARLLERLGAGRLTLKIPTNEMLVLARRR
jgi:SAM-dependent methyltransferase